jgi:protein-disulfide isomerase
MSETDRRSRLLQLTAGAAFLAVAAVLVLIVVSATGSGNGGDTELEGVPEVRTLLGGIPQQRMLLGNPKAPVELVEFGDLQCPICAGYAKDILPPVMETRVRAGEVKISFRNLTILGEESVVAGAAALAAGAQGHGWSFVEIFYRNQGEEKSGYAANSDFLEAIARAAGVKNLAKWQTDRHQMTHKVEETTDEAHNLGFSGTPAFAIEGPKTTEMQPLGSPGSTDSLESAIEAAG